MNYDRLNAQKPRAERINVVAFRIVYTVDVATRLSPFMQAFLSFTAYAMAQHITRGISLVALYTMKQ